MTVVPRPIHLVCEECGDIGGDLTDLCSSDTVAEAIEDHWADAHPYPNVRIERPRGD